MTRQFNYENNNKMKLVNGQKRTYVGDRTAQAIIRNATKVTKTQAIVMAKLERIARTPNHPSISNSEYLFLTSIMKQGRRRHLTARQIDAAREVLIRHNEWD